MGSHAGGWGAMVEVIHLSFGLMTTVSMCGRPIPLSSAGETSVVFLIASSLPCLKNVSVAELMAFTCSGVGV